jgi:DNA polymerase III subunit gamma/tau
MSVWGIKYRPTALRDFIGNEDVIKDIQAHVKNKTLSNRLLITGSTGTGKTSLAYILTAYFTGKPYNPESNSVCVTELNGATEGIDKIREVIDKVQYAPLDGQRHVVILDEAQDLSSAAKKALLKPLESESNVVWILLTDQPHKLPDTMRGRLNNYKLSFPTLDDFCDLGEQVLDEEKFTIDKKLSTLVEQVANRCLGNVRLFLNVLQDVVGSKITVDDAIIKHLSADEVTSIDNLRRVLKGLNPKSVMNIMEVYNTWIGVLIYAIEKENEIAAEPNYCYNMLGKVAIVEKDVIDIMSRLNKAKNQVTLGGVDGRAAFVEACFGLSEDG